MASAPAAAPDNNIAATQSANAATVAANPNIFGGSSSTPPALNSVNSTNLQNTPQVQLPPPPPANTSQANGMVAGASSTAKSVTDYMNQLTPPTTALDQQQQSILDSISSLTGQDANKGNDTLALQQQNGVQAKQQAVTDANNEIAAKTASYAQMQANLGGNGTTETKAVLAAQNAGLAKAQAADIGVSQAKLTAATGNLTLANQQVTDAINLKYSTIEDQIKVQQAQLAAIQPMLTKEQSTEAAAQKQVLADQAQAVADQKAQETQVQNVMLEAAKAGASSDVLSSIQNAQSVPEAIVAAGDALSAPAKQALQQQAFDNNIKLQDLMIQKANLGLAEQKQAQELQPANLFAYAQQYAATGTLPAGAPAGTEGAISQLAASLPKAPGTIYDGNTGVAPSKLTADQETSITGLYNIINNVLPQLSGTYTPNSNGGLGSPMIANVSDYNNAFETLKGALTALNTAGVLKGDASTYLSQVPDASHWYSSGIYTVSGKNQINSLTQTLTQQLNSYLNSNNLKLSGVNDTPQDQTTGPNSSSNLSNFLTK